MTMEQVKGWKEVSEAMAGKFHRGEEVVAVHDTVDCLDRDCLAVRGTKFLVKSFGLVLQLVPVGAGKRNGVFYGNPLDFEEACEA